MTYDGTGPGLKDVQAVVAKYAVQVGWNLDAVDWNYDGDSCATTPCPTAQQIAKNITDVIGTAPGKSTAYGILLMHRTYPWTHDAIPMLFDPKTGYLATHGFKLATVEDAICWKYGMHSWEIVQKLTGQARNAN